MMIFITVRRGVTPANSIAILFCCFCAATLSPPPAFAESGIRKPVARRLAPPYKVIPLSEIEFPRNVSAREWKSPYCLWWSDGVTECKQTFKSNRPTAIRCAEKGGRGEKREFISCYSYDDRASRFCHAITDGSYTTFYTWRYKNSKWTISKVTNFQAPYRGGVPPTVPYRGVHPKVAEVIGVPPETRVGTYCLRPYIEEKDNDLSR